MRSLLVILTALMLSSFAIILKDAPEYNSVFNGKKVSETPFAEYVKDDLSGDNIIMIVDFDCSECVEATNNACKLKSASLVKNVIALGSTFGVPPSDSLQKVFEKKITGEVKYYSFDPEFAVFYKKILALDPKYPQDKHAIYVKDNIIKAVYLKVPTVKEFEKIVKK